MHCFPLEHRHWLGLHCFAGASVVTGALVVVVVVMVVVVGDGDDDGDGGGGVGPGPSSSLWLFATKRGL